MGFAFRQASPPFEETLNKADFPTAAQYAAANALGKAQSLAQATMAHGGARGMPVIVASDTVVALPASELGAAASASGDAPWGGKLAMCGRWAVLEKPTSPEQAVRMLEALGGRRHVVLTAVAVASPAGTEAAAADAVAGAGLLSGEPDAAAHGPHAASAGGEGQGAAVSGADDEFPTPGVVFRATASAMARRVSNAGAYIGRSDSMGDEAAAAVGAALGSGSAPPCAVAVHASVVWFSRVSEAVAEAYVATGEPLDKAGSYGIQGMGGSLVTRLDGDFHSVMGLPMALTAALLRPFVEDPAADAGAR